MKENLNSPEQGLIEGVEARKRMYYLTISSAKLWEPIFGKSGAIRVRGSGADRDHWEKINTIDA